MKYPQSFYISAVNTLYERWMNSLRELKKIKLTSYRKFQLEGLEDDYRAAKDLCENHYEELQQQQKDKLAIILSRPPSDPINKIK